jgi:isopentenyl diphosphate isomerase/L-lactate dehydrogenase-like FMN-dependent dehydrogenase
MRDELRRDMILLGCKSIKELNSLKLHTGDAICEFEKQLKLK